LTDVIKNAETAQTCPKDSTIQAGVSQVQVWRDAKAVFSANLFGLHQVWDATSWKICQLRDNPACADAEHAAAGAPSDPGLHTHVEMAYAFTEAGFDAFDIHMTDLQTGRANLADFAGVVGTRLPIAVAHGEGYANFKHRGNADQAIAAMRFTHNFGAATEAYPFNPNGSPGGLTAVTTADGRFTAMMPHPERVFRNIQMSWTQGDPAAFSAWMPLWHNARRWVG
jgi:hypothetical protein